MRKFFLGALSVALTGPTATAGIYSAAEPSGMRVGPDGRFVELPYVPPFKSKLDDRLNAANPATPDAANGVLTFRGLLKQRLDAWKPEARKTVAEQVAHAVDLIRIGRPSEAVNLLEPRTRDRVPDYLAIVTLAHAHAVAGDWGEASRAHGFALFDAEPPTQLPGVLPELTKRYVELEKKHYARWLQLRKEQAASREKPADQGVIGLFADAAGHPVTWFNAAGVYEPGNLAPAERAKLPADAIAIVQQLLLWAPGDAELLWLLAEVYAATGQLREAEQVFDQCTWGRSFTNRNALMDHRKAVQEAVSRLPKEELVAIPDLVAEPATPNADDEKKRDAEAWDELRPRLMVAGATLGVFAVALVGLAARAAWRRR